LAAALRPAVVSSPAFAFDQAGNAVAVWTQRVPKAVVAWGQFDGMRANVWANRLH